MHDPETSGLPGDHYIANLAISVTSDGHTAAGRSPVRPELFAPGTRHIRTGLLATMVDMVAGHAPAGPVGPTIDLRIQVLAPPPQTGWIDLVCRPVKVGARLIVAETELRAEGALFARSVTTFMHVSLGDAVAGGVVREVPPMAEASFDEFLGARPHGPAALAVEPVRRIANGPQGTVQGGAQALLAELAAEHALGEGRRTAVTDLDIRYLSRLKVGPLVARAERVRADGDLRARVLLVDGGADDAVVGLVGLSLVPLA